MSAIVSDSVSSVPTFRHYRLGIGGFVMDGICKSTAASGALSSAMATRRAVDVFPALFKSDINDYSYFPATGESLAHLYCALERRMLLVEEDAKGVAWWRQA